MRQKASVDEAAATSATTKAGTSISRRTATARGGVGRRLEVKQCSAGEQETQARRSTEAWRARTRGTKERAGSMMRAAAGRRGGNSAPRWLYSEC